MSTESKNKAVAVIVIEIENADVSEFIKAWDDYVQSLIEYAHVKSAKILLPARNKPALVELATY